MLFLKLYNPLNQNMCKQTLHPFRQADSIPGKFDAKFCLRGPFQCWECVLHILDLVVHVPSPPSLSVHSQLPCLDTLEKERTQFACLLNLGCQCLFCFPWIVSKEPSYSVLNGKQVNAMNQAPLWNINVDDFQTFLHPKPCNHVFSCYLCLWPSGYYIFIPILDPFPHVIPHI